MIDGEREDSTSRHRAWGHLADVVTVLAGVGALAISLALLLTDRSSLDAGGEGPASVLVEDWQGFADAGHRLGPADAPVTIVEFGDYQCRYCREAEPHLLAIRRRFGDSISLVFRHFPLIVESVSYTAAGAAECAAEQGAFWDYHRRLFQSRDWQREDPTDAFVNIGIDVGLDDQALFRACVESNVPVATITADLQAVERLGIVGTPAFLVNERLVMGVLDSLEFDLTYRELRR